jgi:hypothetical protein
MTHIAIQEALDGKVIDWLEKVTDEEYFAGPPARGDTMALRNDEWRQASRGDSRPSFRPAPE